MTSGADQERGLGTGEQSLLRSVMAAVGEAATVDAALAATVRAVCEATGWPYGETWVPAPDGERLVPGPVPETSSPELEAFSRASRAISFAPGVGLPGRVWEAAAPAWLPDVTVAPNFPRAPAAHVAGLRASFAVPVLATGRVVAVLEFFAGEPRPQDTELLETVTTVAAQVGTLIERKDAQDALRVSELRFQSVAESATDAIVLADDIGMIAYWNKGAAAVFGYEPEEVVGRPLTILMPERFRAAHQEGIERLRRTGESRLVGETLELAGERKSGEEFPLELSLGTWTAGDQRFVSGVIRDISRRRHIEEELTRHARELERSNADLQQFASVASHDLAEPLALVTGYLELLDRRLKGTVDSEAETMLAAATRAAQRMRLLIDALLAWSRADIDRPEPEAVAAADLIREALTTVRHHVDRTGGDVTVADDLPTVAADPIQVTRVFQNLLSNALKFGADGGPHVQVTAARDGEHWRFTVSDDGTPLSADDSERVFGMFERAHEDHPGSGIGLATCRRIIERHGGEIWMAPAPNGGTSVHFTLPDGAAEGAAEAVRATGEAPDAR